MSEKRLFSCIIETPRSYQVDLQNRMIHYIPEGEKAFQVLVSQESLENMMLNETIVQHVGSLEIAGGEYLKIKFFCTKGEDDLMKAHLESI